MSKAPTVPPATNLRQNAVSTQISLRSAERRKRLPLLEELAKARKSAVLAYVTVGRKNLGTGVGSDVIRIFHDHLSAMGKQKKIDLLLITRGGNTLVPLRLNSLPAVGVSKSSVSRQFIEESGQELERLAERRFEEIELLILYIDGLVFGKHHVICAVGVDIEGRKHVLGIQEGASENAATATSLLEDLVGRGVDPEQRYLFVIDGSKALRSAIGKVFGSGGPIQRCRRHKVRNVCQKLPEDLADQVHCVMKAAYRLPWQEGLARLRKQAQWLEAIHPDAAASLREWLEETFTINRLELSSSLRLCLGTTNLIESPHSGVRLRSGRVSRWRNGPMVLHWVASTFLQTEKHFNRSEGCNKN